MSRTRVPPRRRAYPLALVSERGGREGTEIPCSADGRVAGPLPLRPSMRRWESGGTPDLCPRPVNSRVRLPGGAARVVVAAASWNKGAGASSPSRRGHAWLRRRVSGVGGLRFGRSGVPLCALRSADLGCFCPLRVADEAMASTARVGVPVFRPPRRSGDASSCGAAGLVKFWCVGGRNLLPALSSSAWWLAVKKLPAVAAWCGRALEVAEPEFPLNKLDLPRHFRAGRRGGGAKRFFAESGVSCGFPYGAFLASSGGLLASPARQPAQVGACPPPIFHLRRQGLAAASSTCGDINGTSVSNRLVQVTQRPSFFSSFPTPVVQRRGLRRRRIFSCRSPLGCVCLFFFLGLVSVLGAWFFPVYHRCNP
jgi:hypothetical protein